MKKMKIPWAIPNVQKSEKIAVNKVLDSGWFSMGKEVKAFEENMSKFLNIKHSVGVNSGTAALDIALKCLGIKNGDEIIVPALTYIATGNAVVYNNGKPVFVDVDDTFCINPKLIEEKITERTKAIINIDFGGNPSDYDALNKISKKHNTPLIVDGAQSLGAQYHNKMCCTHGVINTTSFHSAKILTTVEGGMVFTNNNEFYLKSQTIRNQGESSKYIHDTIGHNYRMIDLVASMGNSQIKTFKKTLKNRISKANYYKENLKDVKYPKQLPKTVNSFFFFLILSDDRDKLNKFLNENGIETRITYPCPLNEQPVFKRYSHGKFSMAKKISKKVISLPIYNGLSTDEQDYIIKKINSFSG